MLRFVNIYTFQCWEKGKLLWEQSVENLVTTEGLNDILTQYLKGSSYTAAFFVGLIDNAGFSVLAATDIAAQINGTNGWKESSAYSESTRRTLTLGTASGGIIDNTASLASFTMNANVTIIGAFLATNSGKASTSGKLFGEATIAPAVLSSGQVLKITVSIQALNA